MQGADGGNGDLMGGQRTAELPDTTETVADNSRAGPRPRQSDGANGARSEHGVLVRRENNLLASEATERGPANTGAAGSEGGHGSLANWEGTGATMGRGRHKEKKTEASGKMQEE